MDKRDCSENNPQKRIVFLQAGNIGYGSKAVAKDQRFILEYDRARVNRQLVLQGFL